MNMPKLHSRDPRDERIAALERQLADVIASLKRPRRQLGRPIKKSLLPFLDSALKTSDAQYKLAADLGCSYQRIQNWRKRGKVPAEWVLPLERATGISRHDIRPDLYPIDG